MRLTLNLASAPRENHRRTWVIWGSLCALSFVLLLILSTVTLRSWRAAAQVRAQTARLERQMPALQARRDALAARLRRPPEQQALSHAAYLNSLIDRKAVSWTQLFQRLEALLPPPVQLLSIQPGRQKGQTSVQLTVAADNMADAIPFVRNLEEAPDFSSPRVQQIADQQGQKVARVVLQITALYRPPLGPPSFFGKRTEKAKAVARGARP